MVPSGPVAAPGLTAPPQLVFTLSLCIHTRPGITNLGAELRLNRNRLLRAHRAQMRVPGRAPPGGARWAILRGMPDDSARYHSLRVARYRRWVQRLTLKQYILFAGVVNFVAAAVVGAITSAITGPFSWSWVAVWTVLWTVLMTAFLTWWRPDGLRQGKEHPAGQGDDLTRS